MKHFSFYAAFAFFLCLLNISASAQDTLIRIGLTIDSAEREYFGLFPTIPGFKEAQATMTDSGISFQIRYFFQKASNDTTFSLQQAGKTELIRLLDNFENVNDVEPSIDYNKIQPVGNEEITYPRNAESGAINTFITNDNRVNRMQLLYAADSALLLLHVDSAYHWRSITSAQLLRMKDIRQTVSPDYGWAGWLIGAGVAINSLVQLQEKSSSEFGNILLTQTPVILFTVTQWLTSGTQLSTTDDRLDSNTVVPSGKTLTSQSIFTNTPAPELLPLTKNEYRSTIGEFVSAPNSEWPLTTAKRKSTRIWGTFGYIPSNKKNHYKLAVISRVEPRTIAIGLYGVNIGGDFDLSSYFRLGGSVTFTMNTSTGNLQDKVFSYSPAAYISYVVTSNQPQPDCQIYVGIAADIVNPLVEKNNPYEPSEILSGDRIYTTPALIIGSALSFYLSDQISLISRFESHVSKTLDNVGFTANSPPLLRGFPHSLSFSFAQVSTGLQYSF
jgi:hypothetical protein